MNQIFLDRMQEYLKDEYPAFLDSLEHEPFQGIRINPIKCAPSKEEQRLCFLKGKTPFSSLGYYVHGRYGLHPDHLMGRFYIQEPSASSAVEALDLHCGDVVLDLCAAPGSKSTQIAAKIGLDGFLLANEFEASRIPALLSNLERVGADNTMVTNMDGAKLCAMVPEGFSHILLDAPCSGEGMIKKHEAAADQWSLDNILLCALRQKKLIAAACDALCPGGELVYSTCTYAKEENENVIAWILKENPDMMQIPVPLSSGRPGLETEGMDASMVRRIFPMDGGEGHFVAKLKKKGEGETSLKWLKSDRLPKEAAAFVDQNMNKPFSDWHVESRKDRISVYGMNHPFLSLPKAKVIRQGVLIGEIIKKRFEPAYSLYLSGWMSQPDQALKTVETTRDQMDAYMHGEQLNIVTEKGYVGLRYDGGLYGFGKSDGTRITNKLPKGLRLTMASHIMNEVSE